MTAVLPPRTSAPTAVHHPSHAGLLRRITPGPSRDIDAIVVPTARPAASLRDALKLARDLNCPVVALCSRWATAVGAHREAINAGAQIIATDVDANVSLPGLETSTLLAGTRFERRTDISLKRNVGLALAHMLDWRSIVFLDDDITDVAAGDVRVASAALGSFRMVALENVGFPDNSVVCHALRATGGQQDSFVGGGAMVVPGDTGSFFPDIYNEDWFFLLDDDRFSPVGITGKVSQKEFDPFTDSRRARSEEFGDCLAEGVYALLDDGGSIADADEEFWRRFLDDRRGLIDQILAKIPNLGRSPAECQRMEEALKAAQGRRQFVTPRLCVDYLAAWRVDRAIWRDYLAGLPSGLTPRKALEHLGLTSTQIARARAI